ncbi:NEL-type E3 ubiquitin ligase domain-containing protein [Pseudomonas canadensis]|uniref:NEL-type E3 ubiquitin ligase domain-containing protein n=1 Tax=Pseudomonas canadensis TaxID=915099 RepID=UPI00289297FE|nr:NEL-type E3 ubiquitin ligase domain-containing protein [Pseudomonas canadensis]WNJ83351.1 NEL-type E3 ubiquitin ligase domain-containing protein [Pseudomonas canadensis]
MSDLIQLSGNRSTALQSVHARVIKDRLPSWFHAADLKRKKEFSETLLVIPQWYKDLSSERKSFLNAAYERSVESLNRLDDIFNDLKGPVAFSEPLLVAAMKEEFGEDYDVKRLFFAREAFMPADRSEVFGQQASGYCYYKGLSLIEAALNNFPIEDTLEVANKNASLVTRYDFHQYPSSDRPNQVEVVNRKVSIEPHVFARLCRTLDLGARYLAHVESFVSPADPPKANMGTMATAVRNVMTGATRHQLLFTAEVAVGRKDIHQDAYQLIQQLAANQPELKWRDKLVSFSHLNFLGQPLEQIIVIGHINIHYPTRGNVVYLSEPCLAFIPGDPVCMLKEYADLAALKLDLLERLCLASYRQFFSQFIPYAQQGHFFAKLKRHLDPSGKLAESENYDSAKKNIRPLTASYGTRFSLLWRDHTRQKIDLMLSNAQAMAVSTEAADERARNEWLASLGSIALNVLNVAAFVVPQLAPVMLLIGAAQMLQEVVSGIEAWEDGDTKAAWAHVSAIAFNVASAVIGAKLLPMIKTPLVESLAHVRCPDGAVRLYAPDLRPYQRQVAIPDELTVNEEGLFEHEGGLYLRENNAYYRVERVGSSPDYKILHPDNPAAYTPRVSRTPAGGWAHEHENPLTFTESQLMRRLGPMAERFANEPIKLERILQMSGTEVDTLRQVHADQAPLPALLTDTFKRLEMDTGVADETPPVRASQRAAYQSELFAQRYAAAERAESAAARLLNRTFPSLPKTVVEELLNAANSAEMQVLSERNRVPLRVAEEARHYQQQVRLARAYEGLYRETLANDDTQRMVLHSLETLPDWPADLRIDVVERLPGGERLLDSLGPKNAAVTRRFIKFGPKNLYEVQDDKFAVLNPQADIYGAVQSAVSPKDWVAMKLTAQDGGASLKQALEQMPLMPRDQLRALLRMQPIKPRYKPPMRLADGRVGYPLSPVGGAGRRPFACEKAALVLYPSKNLDAVELMLDLQGASDTEFLAKMHELTGEYRQLETALEAWEGEGDGYQRQSRRRVAANIKYAWQRSGSQQALNPLHENMEYILRLSDEQIGDLPPITANLNHVDCLELSRMSLSDASLPFLKAFGGVRWLDMSGNNFTRLPEFAEGGAQLTTLDLSGNDIRLTEQSRVRLEGMQQLTTLNLAHNRQLGWAANLRNLRDLNQLYLANTGTTTFPTGAEWLNNLDWIDLHTNRITALPEYATQHPERINVHENPVAEFDPASAQGEQPGDHVTQVDARRLWLHDSPASAQARRGEMWDGLISNPGATAFFTVVADTTRCAEYRSGVTRPELAERVWDMIEAAHQSQDIRESLFKFADGRITCGDGSSLEFMNLENELLAEKSLELAGEHDAEAALIGTAERLFRLRLVDIIAELDVEMRGPAYAEKAEVILAYRTRLAQKLDLPVKSRGMLYPDSAGVSQATIDTAYEKVLVDEQNIHEKSVFFVEQTFWNKQLRRQHSLELNSLTKADFEGMDEKIEALFELSRLQEHQGNPVDQAAREARQVTFDAAVDRVTRALGKRRDQILVDGLMPSAFYVQEVDALAAQRQRTETAALRTLTVSVLNQFSAKKGASV